MSAESARRRSPVGLLKTHAARRRFLEQARDGLSYVPAFASLTGDELDLLFELAGPDRAVLGLRRAARFLWRERHLRAVGGDGEAEALVVVALVLLRSDPVRGRARLDAGSERRHRALSAWWWAALLSGSRATHERGALKARVDQLADWLAHGVREIEDPRELGLARDLSVSSTKGVQSALYTSRNAVSRVIFALLLRATPRDIVTGEAIEGLMLVERAGVDRGTRERVELHHVFPKAFLSEKNVDAATQDQYANIALLSGATNGWISGRAPSDYVAELDRHFAPGYVNKLMHSHLLDATLLRGDAFAEQMVTRRDELTDRLQRLLDPRMTLS
jgi:hypothetical protein